MQTVFEYNGKQITFLVDEGSQMVSATQLAKAAGKLLINFESKAYYSDFVNELKKTPEFIKKVKDRYIQTDISDSTDFDNKLDNSIRIASKSSYHGTLYCEELALFYAIRISSAGVNLFISISTFSKDSSPKCH